jgi:glutathione S-transferase
VSKFILYHGNKNYSSWSMRGWLALEMSGADYEMVAFHLGESDVRERIRKISPTGRVPALHHGDLVIWDSLAIAEYLAEQFPDRGMWPVDPRTRAVARAVTAEMHSGFPAMRREMPFNDRRSSPGVGRTEETAEEIERVRAVWRMCRSKHGDQGAFLFGDWCLADVAYAPVVSRFRTYGVELDDVCRRYADEVGRQPHVAAWSAGAAAESWVESSFDR